MADQTSGPTGPGNKPPRLTADPDPVGNPSDPNNKKFADRLAATALGFIAAGVLLSIVVFFHHLTLVPVAVLLSAASGGLGALLGFLFGVPKLADGAADPPPEDPNDDEGQRLLAIRQHRAKIAKQKLLFNTNLGQVSDWVTKIVIGLGIAQFNKILEGSRWLGGRFGDVFAKGLDPAAGSTFGMAVVISSVTFGFMLTYLWTTVRLPQVWSGV